MDYGSDSLKTIEPDGRVPDCRMKDARATQDVARRLIDNDQQRSWKRARVSGLVDGNPPYKSSKLREAGRADACNVNWGIARKYLETGTGAFYDMFAEAPGFITFKTEHGRTPEEREYYSSTISAEADAVLRADPLWDYQMQISQQEMVLHGNGPFMFEDSDRILPRSARCGMLRVPEFTKSDTFYWELATIEVWYYPPELFDFIEDWQSARRVGWDVGYTRDVIKNALDIKAAEGINMDWEYYQTELKNNSLSYYDDSKVIKTAHVFWKEFDGRITHAIVERDSATGLPVQYLYINVGRYRNWNEAIHPMYYDRGNGGYHHSVTGLGVKMYSAMEYENRLLCNLCDKAFSPKILFKPTTTESSQKFSMVRMGDMAVIPAGFDWQQTGVSGLMNDGVAMHELITSTMQGNLAAYQQGVTSSKSGNPVTKYEKELQAAQQSALSMPQFNRYYRQLDALYTEVMRRLSNLNSTDKRAKQFQQRLKNLNVPPEALQRPSYVGATRVIGQGSAFMRKQAIDALFPLASALPETGRANLLNDKIAAEAGASFIQRYNPTQTQKNLATDQEVEAIHWIGDFKQSIPFKTTATQDPVIYAGQFLTAATQSVQSLQQGGDPHEVFAFLNMVMPAVAACLARFGGDPTRKAIHDKMMADWKKLSAVADQLKQKLAQQAQQQQQQAQKTNRVMTNEQLSTLKTQHALALKDAKSKQQLQQQAEKHRLQMAMGIQDLQLSDAKTAAGIHLNRLKTLAE